MNVDPATGIRNRRGYELELGREVARAERSGRPLSVVVVEVDGSASDGPAHERRRDGRAGTSRHAGDEARRHLVPAQASASSRVLLPGTAESGATVLTRRLREAAKQAIRVRRVDHGRRPRRAPAGGDVRRSSTADRADVRQFGRHRLDARRRQERVHRGVRRPSAARSSSGSDVVRPHATDVLRRDMLETLARELADARGFGRSLAVVALELRGLDDVSERHGSRGGGRRSERRRGSGSTEASSTGSVHRLGTSDVRARPAGVGDRGGRGARRRAADVARAAARRRPGSVLSAGITELGGGRRPGRRPRSRRARPLAGESGRRRDHRRRRSEPASTTAPLSEIRPVGVHAAKYIFGRGTSIEVASPVRVITRRVVLG